MSRFSFEKSKTWLVVIIGEGGEETVVEFGPSEQQGAALKLVGCVFAFFRGCVRGRNGVAVRQKPSANRYRLCVNALFQRQVEDKTSRQLGEYLA